MNREVTVAFTILGRITGHRYPYLEKWMTEALSATDGAVTHDLQRLVRDIEDAMSRTKRQAMLQPWRR